MSRVSRKEAASTVTFGDALPRNPHRSERDILAEPEVSPAGNIVQRVGREVDNSGRWERLGHVVMTIPETLVYIEHLQKQVAEAEKIKARRA